MWTRRFLILMAAVVFGVGLAACAPNPADPDIGQRDSLAHQVAEAAVAGDVARLVSFVPADLHGAEAAAQQLIAAMSGFKDYRFEFKDRPGPDLLHVTVVNGKSSGQHAEFGMHWTTVKGQLKWWLSLGTQTPGGSPASPSSSATALTAHQPPGLEFASSI
ncbi:hypothetical protein [Psychromicrobium xiongbiense]|uniref:hypothetical protein n=1 Tax=Psychromicrobium xiongbiense TaxID=3051184 RepID=UPI002552312E|nr:hypothetical protein [Psychromicrobium sp. YIM S02556]